MTGFGSENQPPTNDTQKPSSSSQAGFHLEESRIGVPTAYWVDQTGSKFYIHSRYNPVAEAQQFAKQTMGKKRAVVYGFGLGYHIEAILQENKDLLELIVIDGYPLGLQALDKSLNLPCLHDKRLTLLATSDERELIHALLHEVKIEEILFHTPSLRLLESKSPKLAQLLKEWKVRSSTQFHEIMQENLNIHKDMVLHYPNIAFLFPKEKAVTSKPGILVAAGPSLDKNVKQLATVGEEALILSVGTAVKALVANQVSPDMIIITDPQPVVGKQLEGVSLEVPLVIFPTTHPAAYETYPGPLWFAFQEGIDECKKWAEELHVETVRSGGSVATAALDILIKLRCDPIIFVGQDLAYKDGRTHASHTIAQDNEVSDSKFGVEVEGYGGGKVRSSVSWQIFKKWIEKRIGEASDTQFINATEGGVRISGTVEMSLQDAIRKYVTK
jgi:hypothetical protein